MLIRRLTPFDATAFQALRLAALRLAALRDSPTAFGASYDEEKELSSAAIEARLAPSTDRGPFGAFIGNDMVGLIALGRANPNKLAHKAFIWGLYVRPQDRGQGLGRALLHEALSLARSVPDILQVQLSVNAGNRPAIALYESFGFQIFGHEPAALRVDGALYDELHLFLSLRENPAKLAHKAP